MAAALLFPSFSGKERRRSNKEIKKMKKEEFGQVENKKKQQIRVDKKLLHNVNSMSLSRVMKERHFTGAKFQGAKTWVL